MGKGGREREGEQNGGEGKKGWQKGGRGWEGEKGGRGWERGGMEGEKGGRAQEESRGERWEGKEAMSGFHSHSISLSLTFLKKSLTNPSSAGWWATLNLLQMLSAEKPQSTRYSLKHNGGGGGSNPRLVVVDTHNSQLATLLAPHQG